MRLDSRQPCGKLRWSAGLLLMALAPAWGGAPVHDVPDVSRGQMLYENNCAGCHASVLHVREQHRAKSVADVYAWTAHWADYQKLGWSEDDVADVSAFLTQRYYRFGP